MHWSKKKKRIFNFLSSCIYVLHKHSYVHAPTNGTIPMQPLRYLISVVFVELENKDQYQYNLQHKTDVSLLSCKFQNSIFQIMNLKIYYRRISCSWLYLLQYHWMPHCSLEQFRGGYVIRNIFKTFVNSSNFSWRCLCIM